MKDKKDKERLRMARLKEKMKQNMIKRKQQRKKLEAVDNRDTDTALILDRKYIV